MKTSWHVATAAEAFAAAQFARCGWNVSVQYGANQPEYDLMISDGDRMLKVSVKGSKDGSWGITQSYLSKADYHGAIEQWLSNHGKKTIYCLVQFSDQDLQKLPRMYLATPYEIAERLHATAKGRGDTILYEEKFWGPRAYAAGKTDMIPASWQFTGDRIEKLYKMIEQDMR